MNKLILLMILSVSSICHGETTSSEQIEKNISKIGSLGIEIKPINSIVDEPTSQTETIPDNTPVKATELPVVTVDKKAGTISVYFPDTKETKVGYALYGSVKSDVLDMDVYNNPNKRANHITPAGEFKLTKLFSWKLNEPMVAFIHGKDKIASIHPIWLGNPDQKRVKRLTSPTPDDNFITNGCVNIDPNFFYEVIDKVPTGSKLIILSGG